MNEVRDFTGIIGAVILTLYLGYITLFIWAWSGIVEALPFIIAILIVNVLVIFQKRESFKYLSVILVLVIIGILVYLIDILDLTSLLDLMDTEVVPYILSGLLLLISGITGVIYDVKRR